VTTGDKRFEWQLLVDRQWLRVDNDHVIESHYCHPGAKGISINTTQGQVYIDFDKLQTQSAAMTVRRLSVTSWGHADDIGWYFRDDQLWREYGSQTSGMLASSVSSKEVERHFILNPRGIFTFTVGSAVYTLDLSISSYLSSIYSTSDLPSASSSQLTDGGYKWEFMGDEGKWTEYQICSFDSAAIERQYQLNPEGQLHFRIRRYSYTLDFSSMDQDFLTLTTQHSSFMQGNNQCSMSSQDIELQYQQNPSGTIIFTTRSFSYELNFSAMTQRNLSTNTTKSVRRLNP
uniref:WWE domain-containing protein n=1 Tax=Mola mola TaxID=94237 RepID=A0A3Q3VN61_MOLML